jgi:two-component system sensor histidine kinase VicK
MKKFANFGFFDHSLTLVLKTSLKRMLITNEDDLNNIVLYAPIGICILNAYSLVGEMVNNNFLEITGKSYEAIFGEFYWKAFAESRSNYEKALENVVETGLTFYANEVELMVIRHGKQESIFVTFVYSAIKDKHGKITKIAVWVLENTPQVKSRLAISDLNNELAASNEELRATNEELQDANEELQATNEELNAMQQELEATNQDLSSSRARFRNMIMSSPVAMLVNRGDDLIFEEINQAMLEIIGKDESVKGKPWFEAIPELRGQAIMDILYHTYRTGEERKINEAPITLNRNGVPYQGYYTVTYTAIIEEGEITGVMQSAVDVTDQVNSRSQLVSAYEQARLSKEAAELGTFDLDMEKGTMEWDARCRLLFGINHNDDVTFEKDFTQGLHPEDRERILAIIETVFNKSVSNGVYDVEYRTIGIEDKCLRWIRAKGQAYFDANDKPIRFIGSVLEITEQKEDELRKNDFIAMVSHELKTPLTSLTALIQVTQTKLKSADDAFLKIAMGKANVQVKKMASMINGFLNISRLQSGKLHLNLQRFNLEDLVRDVIEETQVTAHRHDIIFPTCKQVIVHADKDKIGHVISNLLSNAIKYSPGGEKIEVKCHVMSKSVQVSVKDEGLGIKEKDLANLFNRYYRVESPNKQQIAGFGIGLYLSSEIVQAHRGKIWVESEFSKGSTFYFSLPIAYN